MRSQFVVVLSASALLWSCMASAQSREVRLGEQTASSESRLVLKTESDPRGELSFKAIEGPRLTADGESPLRVRFELQNVSGRVLLQPEIEIRVLDPKGAFRGFFGTRLATSLAVGEKRRFYLRTDSLTVRKGDTVVLVPTRSTLKTEGEIGSEPVSRSWSLPEKLTPEQCDRTCEIKETTCDGRCTCGVSSFSCSCPSGGGLSYTCQCMTCGL